MHAFMNLTGFVVVTEKDKHKYTKVYGTGTPPFLPVLPYVVSYNTLEAMPLLITLYMI